jgi:serine/threonine protein kinase
LHMDLKPDNVCLGSTNFSNAESSLLCLIDFGISKSFQCEYSKHIEPGTNLIFQGNVLYASENAFRKKVLSRRDDFISLCYILSYFLNGKLEWLGDLRKNDPEFFKKIGKIKKDLTIEQICSNKAKPLIPFTMEVYNLKFDDEPPYQKLNFLLSSILLEQNKVPSNKFDWSRNKLLQLLDKEEESIHNNDDSDDMEVPDENCDDLEESKGNIARNI